MDAKRGPVMIVEYLSLIVGDKDDYSTLRVSIDLTRVIMACPVFDPDREGDWTAVHLDGQTIQLKIAYPDFVRDWVMARGL